MRYLGLSLVALATLFAGLTLAGQNSPTPEGSLDDELFRGDHAYLEVLCRDSSTDQPIVGVSLSLCPAGLEDDPWSEACLRGVTDQSGRAWFRELATGEVLLRASLEGFADTVIGPLGIGHISPRAPRRVIVVLNPVCWDCG